MIPPGIMNHDAIIASIASDRDRQKVFLEEYDRIESSIDFSALEDDFVKKPVASMLNDCTSSHADTLSTAGDSYSWVSSCEYDYSTETTATSGHLDEPPTDRSLSMDDLKAFFVEDQVGIFNPDRDDLPPPKARTDFKGDSQNSFTLDDLAVGDNQQGDDDAKEESSLGCLFTPTPIRQSTRKSRKHSLKIQPPPPPSIKGILKNGHCNTRRSSSLNALLMESSSMLHLSRTGGVSNNSHSSCAGWSLMQQSFTAEEALDSLPEKKLEFTSVVVHYHSVVPGDNPSVSEGVPLMLAWKAQGTTTYESLDEYEARRKLPAFPVRKLEPEERMFRLLNAGISMRAIQKAEAIVNKTRQQREATRQSNLLGVQGSAFWKALQKSEEQEEELPVMGRRRPLSSFWRRKNIEGEKVG